MKKKERIIRILINNSKRSVFLINKIERIVCVFKNCKKEKKNDFVEKFSTIPAPFLFFFQLKTTKTDVESRRKKSDFSASAAHNLAVNNRINRVEKIFHRNFSVVWKTFRRKEKRAVLEREKWGRGWRRKESCLTYRLITHGLHKPDKVTTNICLLAFFPPLRTLSPCSSPLFSLFDTSAQLRFPP